MSPRAESNWANPQVLRAAWWAFGALRHARRETAHGTLERAGIPTVPRNLSMSASRGVDAVLHRFRATCLERSIVRQSWLAAHGDPRVLVIGVTAPAEGFRAHAWLDGEDPCHEEDAEYKELIRRPAPAVSRR